MSLPNVKSRNLNYAYIILTMGLSACTNHMHGLKTPVAAAAKNQSPPSAPMVAQDSPAQKTPAGAPVAAKDAGSADHYIGPNLALYYTDAGHEGWIHFVGEDAQAWYPRLAI